MCVCVCGKSTHEGARTAKLPTNELRNSNLPPRAQSCTKHLPSNYLAPFSILHANDMQLQNTKRNLLFSLMRVRSGRKAENLKQWASRISSPGMALTVEQIKQRGVRPEKPLDLPDWPHHSRSKSRVGNFEEDKPFSNARQRRDKSGKISRHPALRAWVSSL